jgi:galactokinase
MTRVIDDRAERFFRTRFGGPPAVIGIAPGRVNLIGEHVDYAGGFVLPMAIERRTAIALRPSAAPSMLVSEGFGAAWLGDLRAGVAPIADPAFAWANYILGPLAILAERGAPPTNIECAVVSDVPVGGGVSSSAALEVATIRAMLALACTEIDGMDVAAIAQAAEHRFAGTPCGIMDMAISANAREGHAMLLDCRSLERRHLPLPADCEVAIVDSGVRHRLRDGGYAKRRSTVEDAASRIGVRSLREATLADLERAALPDEPYRRARHVISEIERTVEAARCLTDGDVSRFGELMKASHASLRDDFEVSIPELDWIVEEASATAGILGARMTGGGFGGCAVLLGRQGALPDAIVKIERRFFAEGGANGLRLGGWFTTRAAAGATVVR